MEDRYPTPSLYPLDIARRAEARWIEEYSDTRMAEVFIWRIFNQVAIGPAVWDEPANHEVVQRAREQELPSIMDYLEQLIPASGFLFGPLCIADLSLGAMFRNVALARIPLDSTRWPKTVYYLERVHSLDSFAKLFPIEHRLLRTPPRQHRAVLAELHVPLTPDSYASESPRRGVIRT